MQGGNLELLDVGGKKGEGGQSGGADGEALTGGGGGVTQSVQSVGAAAHVITQGAHFGVTAGVVGDGAVGVRGQGETQGGKHTHSSDTDAVETHAHVLGGEGPLTCSAEVGADGAEYDEEHRPAGGNHTHADTGDNHGGGTGGGVLSDELHRLEFEGGVVLRHLADGDTHHQTDDDGAPEAQPVLDAEGVEHAGSGKGDKHAGNIDAEVQSSHELGLVSLGLGAYQENTDDGKQSADGADDHGSHDQLKAGLVGPASGGSSGCTQSGGSKDGTSVGLVEVSAHAGHVTHVVAHVVGDGGGVTGIVFVEVIFGLTHEVSAYVGSLGVDTTTHTGEECLQRSAHAEGQHDGGDLGQTADALSGHQTSLVEDEIPAGDIEQTEAYHGQTQHSAGAECKLQTLVEAVLFVTAGLGHAAGGVGSRLHADEASQTGEDTTGEEGDGYNVVLQAVVGHDAEHHCDDYEEDGNNLVLLFQVGHGAFAHVARNLLHTVVAFVGLLHVEEELSGKCQRDDGSKRHYPE